MEIRSSKQIDPSRAILILTIYFGDVFFMSGYNLRKRCKGEWQ